MATTTPASIQRKKRPATYGKKKSPAMFNDDLRFFADERALSSKSDNSTRQSSERNKASATIAVTSAAFKPVLDPASTVARQKKLNSRDTFDISSTEDEVEQYVERPLSKVTAKRPLVDDRHDQAARSPGWSDKRLRLDGNLRKSVSFAEPDDQPVQISLPVHSKKPASTIAVGRRPLDIAALHGMNASERLRYRQGLTNAAASQSTCENDNTDGITTSAGGIAKSTGLDAEDSISTILKVNVASKRQPALPKSPRTTRLSTSDEEQLEDSISSVSKVNTASKRQPALPKSPRTTRFSKSDAEQLEDSILTVSKVNAASKRQPALLKSPRTTTLSTARLSKRDEEQLAAQLGVSVQSASPSEDEMIDELSNGYDAAIPSPAGRRSTRSKPSIARAGSQETTYQPDGLTPKQNRLWQDLFQDMGEPGQDSATKSSRNKPSPKETTTITTEHSQSRLVDRLRAAITKSEEPDLGDEQSNDVEMTDAAVAGLESNARRTASRPLATRLTYTQQRSHLAEDNLEDAMMLNFSTTSLPATPRLHKRARLLNHVSDFDIEDDELDAPGRKLRSVHELRAQGKTSRVTAEMDDLVQDLQRTTTTARRTTTLVKLTEKLFDDDFAKAFIQHEHDHMLLKMSGTSPDDLTKVLLAMASSLLLNHSTTEHAIQTSREMLLGMTGFFNANVEITNLISKRKSPVKGGPALHKLFQRFRNSTALWPGGRPDTLSIRILYLRVIEMLVRKLRHSGDTSAVLNDGDLTLLCPHGIFSKEGTELQDATLVISILESLSAVSLLSWPTALVETIATLPAAVSQTERFSRHTRFLAFRLCLNVTNDRSIDHFFFARAGTLQNMLPNIISGFTGLASGLPDDAEQRKLSFDLLILAIGILINLSEYSKAARQAILEEPSASFLSELIHVFRAGDERTREAESEEESTSNVAYGYLSIMLANFCQEAPVREKIRLQMKDKKLNPLVQAVEEFVQHHQKVDGTEFEGAEGQKVWSIFTQRLRNVLVRLKKQV